MNKSFKTFFTVVATAIITLLVTAAVMFAFLTYADVPFKRLIKINSIIKESYVGSYDANKAEEKAINAMLETLDDKYAVYYDGENAKETMKLLDGRYIGIGIEVFANTEKNRIEVISAYEDSPAFKAGVKSGDLIVKIDGEEYTAGNVSDAIVYMKGANVKNPLEKTISLELERDGKRISVQMKREEINMYKIKSEMIDGVCYIRYSGFTEESEKELEKIINGLAAKSVQGIVLDIRNNPGGNLESAIKACDLFLDGGMIMYTEDKSGKRNEFFAEKGANELPLAIIVNRASASASEILAGSLKDRKRAVIVGEKTYGKGVTQTVRYINPFNENDGALKITTYKNYTPSGLWIDEAITPDIEVSAEQAAEDIRSDAAFSASKDYILQKGKEE